MKGIVICFLLSVAVLTFVEPKDQSNDGSDFKSKVIFDGISRAFDLNGPALVKEVEGVIAFKVKNKAGKEVVWVIDAKNGSGGVKVGGEAEPDVTLSMSDNDLYDLMTGELSPTMAVARGKLGIEGDMMMAMKLQKLQAKAATLFKDEL